MFGLGENKKNNEFVFDVEAEARNPGQWRELKEKIAGRVSDVKGVLRSGQDKANFDRFGVLLHGYTALQKVLSRANAKKP